MMTQLAGLECLIELPPMSRAVGAAVAPMRSGMLLSEGGTNDQRQCREYSGDQREASNRRDRHGRCSLSSGLSGVQLDDPDVIAERIAQAHVDAVGLLDRFLREFDTLRAQRFVGLPAVLGREAEREPGRALRDELPHLLRRRFIHGRRTWFLEQNIAARLTWHANGQPAHEPEILIATDLESELADVEVQSLVLVGDEDVRDVDGVQHASDSLSMGVTLPSSGAAALLQNCSVVPRPA